MSELKNFFEEFQPVSANKWRQKIEDSLKGKAFEDLIHHTEEGFDLKPFYTIEDIEPLNIPAKQTSGWLIRQDFTAEDFEATNKKILTAIDSGVDATGIHVKGVWSKKDLHLLLNEVPLERVPIYFFTGKQTKNVFEHFGNIVHEKGVNSATLLGSFEYDPISDDESPNDLPKILHRIHHDLPSFKALTIQSQPFHREKGTASGELTGIIEKLNDCWESLSSYNYEISIFINQVQFSVPVSPNYFLEIAKLRAIRWLWQDWQKKHGVQRPVPAFIQAHKSWKFNDDTDPYHNILMHTTEAMSAIIGGCDVLNLRSKDQTEQFNNEFFERLTKNIQLILKHEAHFDKVTDPARGSYYVEVLTKKLVEIVL